MNQKYSEETKLDAVQAYCNGQGGLKAIAAEYNVEVTSLSRWIADYRAHGECGIRNRNNDRRQYSPEFKHKVIMCLREEGLSYRQAGVKFKIRRFHAIADWERRYEEGGLEGLVDRRRDNGMRDKKLRESNAERVSAADDTYSRSEMLLEINRLRAENAYLKKLQALALTEKRFPPRKGLK